jgi:tetraacyldisaccharide 4'-kinase
VGIFQGNPRGKHGDDKGSYSKFVPFRNQYLDLIRGHHKSMGRQFLRGGLWLASVPFGWATDLRNCCFDYGWKRSWRAPVPVVSVGNLTVGGTGKTPCVEYVARFFCRLDLRVAILSRGYGNTGGANDEALVLKQNLPDVPHYQGADRVALADVAVEESNCDVLVLDDGFQHRRLARDLDLVLVDATVPWGHDHLLPRGLLREPPRSLRRAGAVILTRCDQVNETERRRLRADIDRHAPGMPLVETVHRPMELVNHERLTKPLSWVRQRPVIAFCGLGNPEAFQRTLQTVGATAHEFRTFPDHHAYTRADIEDLRAWARQQATDCLVLTTQKDLVKLRQTQLGGHELWALRIRLQVEAGQEELDQKLRSVVGGL